MANDWIQSWCGKKVIPLALAVEQVGTIDEIAHVLSLKVRFQGHTFAPYSVAEHCVRGAHLLPPAFAGAFLLHELSEVYLPDVPSPVKPFLRVEVKGHALRVAEDGTPFAESYPKTITWVDLEHHHATVMLEALGLSSILPLLDAPEVHRMDLAMLEAERQHLLGDPPEPWNLGVEAASTGKIRPWAPEIAEGQFLAHFRSLFSGGTP